MDTGLLLVAAFCGIWQFVSTTDFGYTLSDTLGQPVLVGALLGIITGQIEQGLLIGGSLELMYLCLLYTSGFMYQFHCRFPCGLFWLIYRLSLIHIYWRIDAIFM